MKATVFLFLSFFVLSCQEKKHDPYVTGMEAKPIPSINILLQDSATYVNISKGENGKTILFYFSPTCPFCRAQMRTMVSNMSSFKQDRIYAITTGRIQPMREFIKEFQLDKYSNVIAGIDTGYVFAQTFKLALVPFTAIYDGEHKLKTAFLGVMTYKSLFDALKI